jgi:hypothetical protein
MIKLTLNSLIYMTLCGLLLGVLGFAPAQAQQPGQEQNAKAEAEAPKVMREFRGVKLDLTSAEVRAALGKPETASDNREEYKLNGDGLLTIHYQDGRVRTIQLYFTDPRSAPSWAEVVGDAEIVQNESGSKHARAAVSEENFWVTMFQSKDQSVTTITISR